MLKKSDLISDAMNLEISKVLRDQFDGFSRDFEEGERDPKTIEGLSRALDAYISWESYEERRAFAENLNRIDTDVREAALLQGMRHSKATVHVLSDHERKRERWCRYAAGCATSGTILTARIAELADALQAAEEERFGRPVASNPPAPTFLELESGETRVSVAESRQILAERDRVIDELRTQLVCKMRGEQIVLEADVAKSVLRLLSHSAVKIHG